MATVVDNIVAKILIQIGNGEPKQIGTVEIPIEVSAGKRPATGPTYRKLSDNPQA